MRLSVGVCLAWLTIFVPSSVYAQTTVPADKPESSAEDAERPSDVQNTRPLDTRGTQWLSPKLFRPRAIRAACTEGKPWATRS